MPKLRTTSRHRLLIILICFISILITMPSMALADTNFIGELDETNAYLPNAEICGVDNLNITRYQLHSAFTVSELGVYRFDARYTNFVTDDDNYYREQILYAFVTTDLNLVLENIVGEGQFIQDGGVIADEFVLDIGETYYLFVADCGLIERNHYDSVDYNIDLVGSAQIIEQVPAIDWIPDVSVLAETSQDVEFNITDDGGFTEGIQVFDKDGNTVPPSGAFYSTTRHADDIRLTFAPYNGDVAGSPYDVTVSAIDNDNNLMTRTFSVDVVTTEVQSQSGRLDDNSPTFISSDNIEVRYQAHSSFTTTADGIYTLALDDTTFTNEAGGLYNFAVIISPFPVISDTWFGKVSDYGIDRSVIQANLKAGETYYLFAVDGGDIGFGNYEAVDYDFTLTGPTDNADAPVIEPIRWQHVTEYTTLTLDTNVTAFTIQFAVLDKNGEPVPNDDTFFTDDGSTVTFNPRLGDSEGSPYTVIVAAGNELPDTSLVVTSSTFTLIVNDDVLTDALDRDFDGMDDEWELLYFGCLYEYNDGDPNTTFFYEGDEMISIRPDGILSVFDDIPSTWAYVAGWNGLEPLRSQDILSATFNGPDNSIVVMPDDCARERLPVNFFRDSDGNPYPAERWDLFDCVVGNHDPDFMYCIMPANEQFTSFDDPDGDGVPNGVEEDRRTNPLDYLEVDTCTRDTLGEIPVFPGADTDCDGLSDAAEGVQGTDPFNPDTDGDGLEDGREFCEQGGAICLDGDYSNTNPLVVDTDDDGISDYDEFFGFDHDDDGNDTVTDPNNPDSDGDGLDDGEEASGYTIQIPINGGIITIGPIFTDPVSDDTDEDGRTDKEELDGYNIINAIDGTVVALTNPVNADTDGDGVLDGPGVDGTGIVDINPNKTDTDGDGLDDGEEQLTYNTIADDVDSDDDFCQNRDGLGPDGTAATFYVLEDGFEINGDLASIAGSNPDGDDFNNALDSDSDNDTLQDCIEVYHHSTNPYNANTDGDDMDDATELLPENGCRDPNVFDSGLVCETIDSDGDGFPDAWEELYFGPGSTPNLPYPDYLDENQQAPFLDDDTCDLQCEFDRRTDPTNPDTDDDGIRDGFEVGTNPLIADTDGDTLLDGREACVDPTFNPFVIDGTCEGTDPLSTDTDNDGLRDDVEVNGYNAPGLLGPIFPDPLDPDSDDDAYTDGAEFNGFMLNIIVNGVLYNGGNYTVYTDPTSPDTDNDGLGDLNEVGTLGLDPANPDTDGDGIPDGSVDAATNGELGNNFGVAVTAYFTDPAEADTDSDGLSDWQEIFPDLPGTYTALNPYTVTVNYDDGNGFVVVSADVGGYDPNDPLNPNNLSAENADSDGDGLTDGEEMTVTFTDPLNPNTDDDDLSDGIEMANGSECRDPLDATDNGLTCGDENIAPVISPIPDVTLGATATQVIQVTATDANGDDITLSMPTAPNFANFVDNGDGTGDLTLSPANDQEGAYTVTLQASDGEDSTTLDVSVTVTPNQKPVFVPIDDQIVEAGQQIQITAQATDPENADVSYRVIGQLPDFVTWDGIDTFTITPNADNIGIFNITVEASDGFERRWERFMLTVDATAINDKPVFEPIPDQWVGFAQTENLTVLATDPEGADVSYRVIGQLPDFVTWDGIDTFTFAPLAPDTGRYPITVEASDGVQVRWERFDLIVVPPANNQRPEFVDRSNRGILAGTTRSFVIEAIDPEGADVRITPISRRIPEFISWDGVTDTLTVSPSVNDFGRYQIIFQASDGIERRWEILTFVVTRNEQPVFEPIPNQWIAIGQTRTLTVVATDPNGRNVRYQIVGGVANLPDFITWDGRDTFTFVPQAGDNGSYPITVIANDGIMRRWEGFDVKVINPPN